MIGLTLVWFWFINGSTLVWFIIVLALVYFWFITVLTLVWFWFINGFTLVWFWFINEFTLVWFWFIIALTLVWFWFIIGLTIFWFWFIIGLTLVWFWFIIWLTLFWFRLMTGSLVIDSGHRNKPELNKCSLSTNAGLLLNQNHFNQSDAETWIICENCHISNISCTLVGRCSWSIACRRCSNYIFILDLTPGFNGLGKDNCKMRQQTFKFWDLVQFILEVWR